MAPLDFGYTWPWTHGHLVLAALAASGWLLARWRKWPVWMRLPLAAFTIWAVAGFLILLFAFRMNEPLALPTSAFLASGAGKVLDMGAGSGRATLMVLLSRPGTTVVALDNFSAAYIKDNGPEKILSNMRAAGVEQRVRVQPGDMRQMPLESGSFDAVVSSYAIDHLGSQGAAKALAEAERVLRPGGEFLLLVLHGDLWMSFAYPPLVLHGRHGRDALRVNWRTRLERAGFHLVEEGALPATKFFLCRKPAKSGG